MTEPQKAERDAAFEKWCPIKIIDEDQAKEYGHAVRCWRSGWNAAWEAAFEAGRSADKELRGIIDLVEEWTAKFPLGHAMDLKASDEIHERITRWKEHS